MAANTFIITSPKASLEALRYQGILVSENCAQIKASLRKNLGPEHAAIFATPYMAEDELTIDWYSEAEGPVTAWADLSAQGREQALVILKSLGADIAALARELKNNPDEAGVTRGHILSLALRYPAQENIFMVGRQPVLTCWGFISASSVNAPEDLTRAGLAAPPFTAVPAAVPSAVPSGPALTALPEASASGKPAEEKTLWPRLLSLWPFVLGFLLVITALYILSRAGCADAPFLRGCSPQTQTGRPANPPLEQPSAGTPSHALSPPAAPPSSPRPEGALAPAEAAELAALVRREQELRSSLDELRRQLMLKASQCRNTPPPTPAGPPDPVPEKPEIPPLADLLPRTPDRESELKPNIIPERGSEPEVKPSISISPETEFKPGDELRIPDGARDSRDPGFLQGCWLSNTNIYNSDSGETLTAEYCFDREGNGSRTVRKANGETCTGPARARFDADGRLIIDSGIADCNDGGAYVPQEVECSGSGDSVDCRGQEISPQAPPWRAGFRRK
ncbi:MAG: SrfA family protein [Desulfarculales bacterium]|jgi:hypothetical protein|nr:SrfA family protein [Desulfarculales bacterium]